VFAAGFMYFALLEGLVMEVVCEKCSFSLGFLTRGGLFEEEKELFRLEGVLLLWDEFYYYYILCIKVYC